VAGEVDILLELLADEVFDWVYGTSLGEVSGEGDSWTLFEESPV
jgi:hypothetical protein